MSDKTNFAQRLVNISQTHAQWVQLMRFGLGTLVEDQPLLLLLICDELDRRNSAERSPAEALQSILEELRLQLVPLPPAPAEPETIRP